MSETSEVVKQVTKEKNPGRVQAGHRLKDWNRKNKENLLKNQKQEPTTETLSEISTTKPVEISTTKPVEISTTKPVEIVPQSRMIHMCT